MSKFNYILGGDSITVFVDGNSYTINKQAPTYKMVLDAVKSQDYKALVDAVNIRQGIANKVSAKGKGRVSINDNVITYDGVEVTGLISSRIFEVLSAGLGVDPMVRFLENLMENPSRRAVLELFGFIDACRLPITEDGHFLAYKRVRDDYKDVHSGTFDNSVGQVLEMPRNAVDEDKDRTCSAGLHFCSYDYLKSFGGSRIMVLKINPRDVVAIPSDYNNSKGRTCRYEVVDEIPVNEYNLPSTPIADGFTTGYVDNSYDDDSDWEESWEESYEDEGPLTILSEYEIEDMVDLYNDEDWTVEELADYFETTVDDVNDILKARGLLDNTPAVVPASVEVANGVKLTPTDVKAIRKLLNKGETLASIARQFGVHPRSIARIRDGEAWADV